MAAIVKYLIDSGELAHVIYAGLAVLAVAIVRGFTVGWGDKSISFGKQKDEKLNND